MKLSKKAKEFDKAVKLFYKIHIVPLYDGVLRSLRNYEIKADKVTKSKKRKRKPV